MSTRQEPAEQLLDLLVYAPLGLLLEARDLLPKLAEKGRQRMGGQVTVARMIGEMAVRQGQRRAETVVQRMHEQNRPPQRAASPDPAPSTNGHDRAASASASSAAAVAVDGATPAPTPGFLF